GEESSVWMCAVLRGDVHWIKVGRRTNVQDGSVVHAMTGTHPTSIGDNVTIGHAAVIHGCSIEHQCLIGMGATLMNGAHIGAGSIVAAGTVVVEGMKVAPRSLVMGSPGKVKRLLTQAALAEIQLYADRYVGYRLGYMPGQGGRAREVGLVQRRSPDCAGAKWIGRVGTETELQGRTLGSPEQMADKQSTKPPAGTRDFLPDDIRRREYVIDVIRRVYEIYGFEPLET